MFWCACARQNADDAEVEVGIVQLYATAALRESQALLFPSRRRRAVLE